MRRTSIELPLSPDDDPGFLVEVEQILSATLRWHQPRLCSIYKVDNWFDHKWLITYVIDGKTKVARPRFSEKRLLDGRFYILIDEIPYLREHLEGPPVRQLGWRFETVIHTDEEFDIHPKRVRAWYSGNSKSNKRGAGMFHLLPAGDGDQATAMIFYVGYVKRTEWKVDRAKGISLQELDRIPKNWSRRWE